ncbi:MULTISPECIES: hypothetical protein [unclassified Nodularia (in: cyanobacteria)]|uniref:hypothetical protein n=1 Tax=unclassified Nodularia (in: cyanobacteria) TaxID=2656917 RepID=UPI001881A204|nr:MULTISPECIES: hypothetical protein [unclassified Nodularia (in: cyanobacteria)]MBE9197904.1 hypothetical protein [Nodularia sp. LEGE 06071]MCC2693521.1 hypothetical protein [Nodularia sp. LEGE 04288]
MSLVSNYLIDLKQVLIPEQEDIWSSRLHKSAHHLLAAICFRENSQAIWESTNTILLPPIGFYYSVFHLSIAALFIDYQTQTHELTKIKHQTLKKYIKERLMQRKLLPNSYLDTFQSLQEMREYANYSFGKKIPKYEFMNIGDSFYINTQEPFDLVIDLIHNIQNTVDNNYSFYLSIQTAIGDGFGDDLIRMYLPKNLEEKVVSFLIKKNLTT